MQMNYGPGYAYSNKGFGKVSRKFGIQRLKHGWLVRNATTGEQAGVFPTKLRALYVAARYNGTVTETSTVFYFGDVFGG